jgi:hypothetical protein
VRSQPITQVDVEEEIMRLVETLEARTENFEQLAVDAAEKEADFKKVWAGVYLETSGTIRDREANADVMCTDAFREHKIAEALVKSARESLLFLRTSIDALRSLNANVRYQTND